MADPDIVVRLREEGFVTHMARLPRESKLLHEAADEIERLRQLVGETDKLRTALADAKRQLSQHALDRLALLDERIGLE